MTANSLAMPGVGLEPTRNNPRDFKTVDVGGRNPEQGASPSIDSRGRPLASAGTATSSATRVTTPRRALRVSIGLRPFTLRELRQLWRREQAAEFPI